MALIDQVAATEARLDASADRRGQRVADVITVALAVPLLAVLGPSFERPLLLLGLMLAALALNRTPGVLRRRKLRAAHERLLQEHADAVAQSDSTE